jgi:photosystem II stability/assembly factor-like uncharacterized protein
MKQAAALAIVFLLLIQPSIQSARAQNAKPRAVPVSLLPQLTTDAGTSRFAGPWQEVTRQSFAAFSPAGGTDTTSGQVSAIAIDLVHDSSGNTVYVGSSSGGVWRSINGLSANPTFTPMSDPSQSLSVGALALDTRTNPPKIYVGTGAPDNSANISGYTGTGILSTADGGATWIKVDSADSGTHTFVGLGFSSILIDPQNPDILLAATGMANDPNHPHSSIPQGDDSAFKSLGIYRSSDAGKTWKQVMSGKYNTFAPCWGTPDILFPFGFFHIDLIYEPTQQFYYAGVSGVGLFVSKDQGATWQSFASLGLGSGLPTGSAIYKASLAARNGQLWAFLLTDPCKADGFGLFGSVDGGVTWQTMTLPSGDLFKGALMYVAAPPNSSFLLLATYSLFAWDTLSLHPAWNNIQHNLHYDQHAIAFAGAKAWYAGNDGGMWSTIDSGNTWQSMNAGLRTLEFFSADMEPGGVFGGGLQDNGSVLASRTSTWLQVLSFVDGGYLTADPGLAGAFFMSTNSGGLQYVKVANPPQSGSIANFGKVSGGADFLMPFEVLNAGLRSPVRAGAAASGQSIVQNGRILLVGASNPFLLALDTSTLLNPCQVPADTPCNKFLPSNPQAVRLTGSINQLIHYVAPVPDDATKAYLVAGSQLFQLSNISFAGNASVTPINTTSTPFNGSILGHAAAAPGGNTLYVIKAGFVSGEKIFKTTDAGKSWTNISGNLPNVPMNWITLDPVNPGTIYLASNIGVFEARDGGVAGETWRKVGTGLPNVPVTQLKIVSGRQLLAATYGRNAWIISDPCQPLRDQFNSMGATCDPNNVRLACSSKLQNMALELRACELQNGEL